MSRPRWIIATALATLAAAGILAAWRLDLLKTFPVSPPRPELVRDALNAPAAYVGGKACGGCHAAQLTAWQGSDHDLAMQEVSTASVLGNFEDTRFAHGGVTSTMFRRDGRFMVRTDGPDGRLADFEVRYTFGVRPLQQYLLALPGGRLQALGVAWDSRPADRGGQRWFHVYGNEHIDHTDVLHWTRPSQNWDSMCADCHSTGLVKRYDLQQDRFTTTWADINVACEACHGPGSRHVAWAKHPDGNPAKGLSVRFSERRNVQWLHDPATGNSHRSAARVTQIEIESCGPCHARRARIADRALPGQQLLDGYLPELPQPPLYYPDGQMRDEVYNYGSFLQSRMNQQGVTCSDCHEPHSVKLRAPGSQVCLQCHLAEKYAATTHHLHPPDSAGAGCIGCHMPATNYMQVDARHDHSFRIPRLSLDASLGIPDPCTRCHTDRDLKWAQGVLNRAGRGAPPPESWVGPLARLQASAAPHDELRWQLAGDRALPPVIRATALARNSPLTDAGVNIVADALQDADGLIRWAAVQALQAAAPAVAARLVPPMLQDPLRAVRLEATRLLSELGPDLNPASGRADYQRGLDEYIAAQHVNDERPEAHSNLGNLYRNLGRSEESESEYRTAIRLAPYFVPAYVNLADLFRSRQRDDLGARVLAEGLRELPDQPALLYARGLLLVRQHQMAEASVAFEQALRRDPSRPEYPVAYALTLQSLGRTAESAAIIKRARQRFPDSADLASLDH